MMSDSTMVIHYGVPFVSKRFTCNREESVREEGKDVHKSHRFYTKPSRSTAYINHTDSQTQNQIDQPHT